MKPMQGYNAFSLMLTNDWVTMDISEDTTDAAILAAAERAAVEHPEFAEHAAVFTTHFSEFMKEARSGVVQYAATFFFPAREDYFLQATLAASLHTASDTSLNGLMKSLDEGSGTYERVRLNAGWAIRRTMLWADETTVGTENERGLVTAQYYIPSPRRDGYLAGITFSSANWAHRESFLSVFESVAETFEWVNRDPDAVIPPIAVHVNMDDD